MKDTSLTITSCGRIDLLEKTLDSFLKYNKYPIKEFLLTEDSEDETIVSFIKNKYPFIKVFFNKPKLGLLKSLDLLYSNVNSEYIFHTEDDWEFLNSNFIEQSIEILENYKNVNQVWLRKDIPHEWLEHNIQKINNTKFKMVKQNHISDWSGFSWNPGLRRLSDYNKMFPNGFSEFEILGKSAVFSEYECNKNVNKFNYRAANLLNGCCKHIGHGRTTL